MYSPQYFAMQVRSKPSTPMRAHEAPALARGDIALASPDRDRAPLTRVGNRSHGGATPTSAGAVGGRKVCTPRQESPPQLARHMSFASAMHESLGGSSDASGEGADGQDACGEREKQLASMRDLVGVANRRVMWAAASPQPANRFSTPPRDARAAPADPPADVPNSPYAQRFIAHFLESRRRESANSARQSRASVFYHRLRVASEREQDFALIKSPTANGKLVGVAGGGSGNGAGGTRVSPRYERAAVRGMFSYEGETAEDVAAFGAARVRVSCELGAATQRLQQINSALIDDLTALMTGGDEIAAAAAAGAEEGVLSPSSMRRRRSMRRIATASSPARRKDADNAAAAAAADDFLSGVSAVTIGDDASFAHLSARAASMMEAKRAAATAEKAPNSGMPQKVHVQPLPPQKFFSFPLSRTERETLVACMGYCCDTGFIANAAEFRYRVGWQRGDVAAIVQTLAKKIDVWERLDFGTVEWNVMHNCLTELRQSTRWPAHGVMPPLLDARTQRPLKEQLHSPTVTRRAIELLHSDLLNSFAKAVAIHRAQPCS